MPVPTCAVVVLAAISASVTYALPFDELAGAERGAACRFGVPADLRSRPTHAPRRVVSTSSIGSPASLGTDVRVDRGLPRQAEGALADDVALDLVGAAAERRDERRQPGAHHPAAVAGRSPASIPSAPSSSSDRSRDSWASGARSSFMAEPSSGRRDPRPGQVAEALAVAAMDLAVHVVAHHPVADARAGRPPRRCRRAAITSRELSSGGCRVGAPPATCHERIRSPTGRSRFPARLPASTTTAPRPAPAGGRGPLVRERRAGHVPPAAERPDDVVAMHPSPR